MTPAALRELWEKTTPGRWINERQRILSPERTVADMRYINGYNDAHFIAAAHNEMGKLLDVVEAAKRIRPACEREHDESPYEFRYGGITQELNALDAALAKLEG